MEIPIETEADKEAQHKLSENEPSDFKDELIDVGIDGPYLANKLKEEFEAEETKFFADKGSVIDEKDVIAWGIRQKARQDTHKLRGDYPSETVDHTGGIIVNIEATPIKKKKKGD